MKGWRPKPTVIKQLEGNPGKRRLNDAEPQPPVVVDDAVPAELLADLVAVAEWQRLAPMLRAIRVLTAADTTSLLSLCLEWSRYLEAISAIREGGMIIVAPSGYPLPTPYLAIANRALGNCIKLWQELGLTPSSRSRVHVTGPGPDGDAFTVFDQPYEPAKLKLSQ